MEKKRILKNGIELYSYTADSTHSFYISLFLKAGSMYESEQESGITHFFEHVSIRSVNKLMDGRLYGILDRYGLDFNAATYNEMVQFYICGAPHNFKIAADIISRLLLPPELSGEELDAERRRIKAEIREADERSSLSSFSNEVVYGESSLARSITGTLGSVSKINSKRLKNFWHNSFTKDNLFFYVTGNVSKEDLDYLAQVAGGIFIGRGEVRTGIAPVPDRFFKRDRGVYIKNADFTKLKFTFDLDMTKISVPEADLLYESALGGYNSRFFVEMSEKRGLFYDISGSVEEHKNIGTLSFSFEVREADIYEAAELAVELLLSMKRELLSDGECMKAGFVDNAPMLLDDPRELNFTLAYDNHILSLGYKSIEERIQAYNSVTPERIRETARLVFTPKNLTLALKGNKKRIDRERLILIINKL